MASSHKAHARENFDMASLDWLSKSQIRESMCQTTIDEFHFRYDVATDKFIKNPTFIHTMNL